MATAPAKALADKVRELDTFATRRGMTAIPWQQIITALLSLLGGCGLSAAEAAEHVRAQCNDQHYAGWRWDRVTLRSVVRQHAPDRMDEVEAVLKDHFDRTTGEELKAYHPEFE